MKAFPVAFDTSVYISRKVPPLEGNVMMISVVLQEMTAGAADHTALRFWETVFKTFEKHDRLLVPTSEDWWQAGRVLNLLLRGLKSKSGGLTPKLPVSDKQRIIRDVLIARTAKRAGVTVITDNLADFGRIKRYCSVRILSADEYFRQKA